MKIFLTKSILSHKSCITKKLLGEKAREQIDLYGALIVLCLHATNFKVQTKIKCCKSAQISINLQFPVDLNVHFYIQNTLQLLMYFTTCLLI